MAQLGIKNITFQSGLLLDELVTFLEGLNDKSWRSQEGKMISDLLKEHGIEHISVHQKLHVALGEGDLVIEKGLKGVEGFSISPDEFVEFFEEAAKTVSAVTGEEGKVPTLEIARRMINQNPKLLLQLLREELPPIVEDAKREILQELSPVKIKEIITEIANVYHSFKETAPSSPEAATQAKQMGEILKNLLPAPDKGPKHWIYANTYCKKGWAS